MAKVIWESVQVAQFVVVVVHVAQGATQAWQLLVIHTNPELQEQVPDESVILDGAQVKHTEADEQFPQGDVQAVQT